jgi:hypothetical protein
METALMETMEQLEIWRAEIEAELAAAQDEAANAADELAAATIARNTAHAQLVAMRFALSELQGPLANAVVLRAHLIDQEARATDAAAARAGNAVTNAGIRVADLTAALEQLTQLLAPPPADESGAELVEEVA